MFKRLTSYHMSFLTIDKFDQTARNQQQKENWKTHKYVEIRQYTPKQPMCQIRNQNKLENTIRNIKTKTQHIKIHKMPQRQYKEGS